MARAGSFYTRKYLSQDHNISYLNLEVYFQLIFENLSINNVSVFYCTKLKDNIGMWNPCGPRFKIFGMVVERRSLNL